MRIKKIQINTKEVLVYFRLIIIITLLYLIGCNKKDELEEAWVPGKDWIDIRDEQAYKTIKIGDQVWMGNSLNYRISREKDGPGREPHPETYTWFESIEICPTSWHLPSDDEWKELEFYLGMDPDEIEKLGWRGTDESNKLKEGGSSGFEAKMQGYLYNKTVMIYKDKVNFWASSYDTAGGGIYLRELDTNTSMVKRDTTLDLDNTYYSVRCLKNQ